MTRCQCGHEDYWHYEFTGACRYLCNCTEFSCDLDKLAEPTDAHPILFRRWDGERPYVLLTRAAYEQVVAAAEDNVGRGSLPNRSNQAEGAAQRAADRAAPSTASLAAETARAIVLTVQPRQLYAEAYLTWRLLIFAQALTAVRDGAVDPTDEHLAAEDRAVLQQIMQVLGPSPTTCCEGCQWETDEVLRLLRAAGIAYRARGRASAGRAGRDSQ